MDLLQPRPKKNCRLPQSPQLPIIFKKDGSIRKLKGIFNDFCVIIEDEEDMKNVVSMGTFGKANFSRSYPQFHSAKTEIIRARQYERRKEWFEQFSITKNVKKVIVLPDSDEEIDDYFVNLKPEYQIDRSGLKETVWLSLEEAFFLCNALNCLNIFYDNQIIQSDKMWTLFSKNDPQFIPNYITYYYYRTKNWIVKTGIKFGGDFLLYQQGPASYHASYVVIIDILNENLERITSLSRRCMDNVSLTSINRLCETTGKELIIFQIIWPDNIHIDYNDLTNFTVKEILMRRWLATQERNTEDT